MHKGTSVPINVGKCNIVEDQSCCFITYQKFNNTDISTLEMSPLLIFHYSDVIMTPMAAQITGVSIVCSSVCLGTDQGKHQSSASLAFVEGIHRWPVDSPLKGPVSRNMFPFDDVVMFFFMPCILRNMQMAHIIAMDLPPTSPNPPQLMKRI